MSRLFNLCLTLHHSYQGLTREEHLVFSHIDAAGNQGLWTRTLQKRLQAHAKVLERTYKSLEQKGKIKGMKSVKHPTRKMYIVAGLQPSEDATGGAWFHDGNLDQGSIDGVAMWAEKYISDQSWVAVKPNLQQAEQVEDTPTKGKGKSKAASIDDEQPRSISPEMHHREQKSKPKRPPTRYYPHPPGHHGYPTAAMITNEVNASGVIKGRLPVTAVTQLLEVMVYDDKLYKMYRELRSDEISLDSTTDQVAMYRCFKTPGQLEERFNTTGRLQSHSASTRKAARREVELEEVGRGGASEVPCLKCPAFDICGDGGPVNVVTCPYFDEWYLRTARADRDDDHPWADGEDFLKVGERRKQQRIDAITRPPPPVPIEIKTEAMDTTA